MPDADISFTDMVRGFEAILEICGQDGLKLAGIKVCCHAITSDPVWGIPACPVRTSSLPAGSGTLSGGT